MTESETHGQPPAKPALFSRPLPILIFIVVAVILDQAIKSLDVGTRRDFRHHASESTVLFQLRQNDIGDNLAAPVRMAHHNGSSCLIAACFDAENTKNGCHGESSLPTGRLR